MKAKFIEEIPKTQNYLNTENGPKIIKDDFYYCQSSFINKHIKIVFSIEDAYDHLIYGCEGIDRIVHRTVYSKMKELGESYGLLIEYKIIDRNINDKKEITIKVLITNCEADC